MKRGLHELSERERIELQDSLRLPVGEIAALIFGALLTLAFFLGPPTLAADVRDAVRVTAATVARVVADLGDRPEARAAEHHAAKPR